LVSVSLLGAASRAIGVPYPIVLVLGGLVLGFVPGLPEAQLEPELVLVIFLPPLLYSAAFFASLRDLKADLRREPAAGRLQPRDLRGVRLLRRRARAGAARAGEERRSRRVRAGEDGRFRVRFRHLPYDPCSSDLRASARGPDGLRASYKRPQRMCPMPLRDEETPPECRGADLEGAPPAPPRCNVP